MVYSVVNGFVVYSYKENHSQGLKVLKYPYWKAWAENRRFWCIEGMRDIAIF